MGLKKLFGYDVRDVWRKVASDIGAEYEPGTQVLLQRPKITLHLGAQTVVADVHSPGTAGVQDDETWVRARLESFHPFTFEVRDRTIWASARRLFGTLRCRKPVCTRSNSSCEMRGSCLPS